MSLAYARCMFSLRVLWILAGSGAAISIVPCIAFAQADVQPAPTAPGVQPASTAPGVPPAPPESEVQPDDATTNTGIELDANIPPAPQVEVIVPTGPSEELLAERERRREIRMRLRLPVYVGIGGAQAVAMHPDSLVETGVGYGFYQSVGFGIRKAFRWLISTQGRIQFFHASLGCSSHTLTAERRLVDVFDASDCRAFGVSADATFRVGPVAWKFPFFAGVGPELSITHVEGTASPVVGSDRISATTFDGGLVAELGFALGSQERGEIALRGRISGLFGDITTVVLPELSVGFSFY